MCSGLCFKAGSNLNVSTCFCEWTLLFSCLHTFMHTIKQVNGMHVNTAYKSDGLSTRTQSLLLFVLDLELIIMLLSPRIAKG